MSDQMPDRVFEDDNAGYIMEWKNPTRFMVFEHHPCRMGNPRKESFMIADIFRGSADTLESAKVILYGNTF